MRKLLTPTGLGAAVFAIAFGAMVPSLVQAAGDPPEPRCPSRDKRNCRSEGPAGEEQIYNLGYWQAKSGAYEAALATLRTAKNQADPRIQTMIGFALRKLGRVDEALGYYGRALASNPDLTSTRQYLGEAFLQMGRPDKAREQLSEIALRCGTACDDYQTLAAAISKVETKG